jgi:hypothetical protein
MKHKFVLVSASVFAMSGLVSVAHATSLDDVCNKTITEDTKVNESGEFTGECRIKVDNAKLEIVGVTIAINNTVPPPDGDDGQLRIDDDTGDEGVAELVIKNAKITTGDRLRIEEAWDGGVTFKNNHVETGDDLRVKPIGSGDLIFKNNRGQVVDDIRLGDVIKDDQDDIIGGLDGDMDVRNNRITMVENPEDPEDRTEFVAQSFDGHINVRNNRFGNRVEEIDIKSSGSGNIGVKNNRFLNTETVQEEIFITSEHGDVGVWNNTFGESVSVDEENIDIDSTTAQCESKRNRPELVDRFACPSP